MDFYLKSVIRYQMTDGGYTIYDLRITIYELRFTIKKNHFSATFSCSDRLIRHITN